MLVILFTHPCTAWSIRSISSANPWAGSILFKSWSNHLKIAPKWSPLTASYWIQRKGLWEGIFLKKNSKPDPSKSWKHFSVWYLHCSPYLHPDPKMPANKHCKNFASCLSVDFNKENIAWQLPWRKPMPCLTAPGHMFLPVHFIRDMNSDSNRARRHWNNFDYGDIWRCVKNVISCNLNIAWI